MTSSAADQSSLSTWSALCKDCRNSKVGAQDRTGRDSRQAAEDLRQPEFEYSDLSAARQFERGQSRSDRCPECRKRHRKEISAFPVAYIDIRAIGEAARYQLDPQVGPTGPLGGLGPLPPAHRSRTEDVDLSEFKLGLTAADMLTLLGLMQTNHVVILEAGTGTGKSTLAPFRLMNPPPGAPYRPTDRGPIVVTEPRVPATTEIAHFVGETMCFGHKTEECNKHIGPGYPVGFQCEGKKVWDEACSLIYVTDGTMVNWIANGDLARIGTVIVDEAHERSENIDLILTLLAAKLPQYPHLRVLIASATIDKTYFMRFFEQTPSIRVGHYYAEATKAIGYGVPLFADSDEITFDDTVLSEGFTAVDPEHPDGPPRFKLPGWPDESNREEGNRSLREITKEVLLGIRHPAPSWPDGIEECAVEQTLKILEATTQGDVLVFLPTQTMVTSAQEKIAREVKARPKLGRVTAHWLMRATPPAAKKAALAACAPGERKVVVASNLAETSLTIAGIKYVVDSGMTIQASWDPVLGVSHAPLLPHSQSGIRQRWGRVGRKTHGWVFPLYSLADYLAMPRDTPAGSTQTNLEGSVLRLIAAGEDPQSVVFPADFVAEGVERDSYASQSAHGFTQERRRAFAALQTNGAISADGRTLTGLGREIVRSRLSPEKAIAIMFADRLACVPEVAIALVALGGVDENDRDKGVLAGPDRMLSADPRWPSEWNVQARRAHAGLAHGCIDDLDLVIRIFSEWRRAADPSRWCAQWWVNETVLERLDSAGRTLMDSLAPGMSKEATRPLDPRLTMRARAVFSRALGSLRYEAIGDGKWRSANASQPDPVVASWDRLVIAPRDVIALARQRPRDGRAGTVAADGQILGLIARYDWAADGEPTDFELLRRVSKRRAEAIADTDPLRALRPAFAVGTVLALGSTTSTMWMPRHAQQLSGGLVRPAQAGPVVGDTSAATRVVYTSETGASSREIERSVRGIGGVEVPEEEMRLLPLPVAEIEEASEEDLTDLPLHAEPSSTPSQAEPDATRIRLADGPFPPTRPSDDVVVVAYRSTGGSLEIVVEPVNNQQTRRAVGEEVPRAIGCASVATHFGRVAVLRECDTAGIAKLRYAPHYLDESILDANIFRDPDAVEPNSLWSGVMIPGRGEGEPARLNLSESALERLRGVSSPGSTSTSKLIVVDALMTDEDYRDHRGGAYWIAKVDAASPGFTPRVSIRARGDRPAVGARLRLELQYARFARRSGTWDETDVERLSERYPSVFEIGSSPTYLRLKSELPLTDFFHKELLDCDPGNQTYTRNAWLLWATSRKLSVRNLAVVAQPQVPKTWQPSTPPTRPTPVRRPTDNVRPPVVPASQHTVTRPPSRPSASPTRHRNRAGRVFVLLLLVAAAAGAIAIAVQHRSHPSGETPPQSSSPVPAPVSHYVRAAAPGGFSVQIPRGWRRDHSAGVKPVRDMDEPHSSARLAGTTLRIGVGNSRPSGSFKTEARAAASFLRSKYSARIVAIRFDRHFGGTSAYTIEYRYHSSQFAESRHGIERIWRHRGKTLIIATSGRAQSWSSVHRIFDHMVTSLRY